MASVCESELIKDVNSADQLCPPDCQYRCPPNCQQYKKSNRSTSQLIITAIGILITVFATYMLVSRDSKLYLVFWIVYSVLRRLMVKSKPKSKTA